MQRTLSITATFFAIVASVVCLVWMVYCSDIPLNHDSAILLDCGRMILHGAIPYVDYVEMNPPITHYVHAIPVALAGLTGIDLPNTFHTLILLLICYSTAALVLLFGKPPFVFSPSAQLFVSAVWLSFCVFSIPIGGFGQREHLFVLAYAPWMVCRQIRHSGHRIPFGYSLTVGLLLGPLLLMKPHFVGIAAILEAWMLVRSRRFTALFSSDALVVAGCALVYAGHFLFVPSAMNEELLGRWMPFVAKHYWVYNCSFSDLLAAGFPKHYGMPAMPLLGLGLILAARKISQPALAKHVELCGLGTLLGLACFVVLHKGWNYQLVPAYAFLALALCCLPVAVEDWSEKRRTFLGLPSSLAATALVIGACISLIAGDIMLTRQGLANGSAVRPSLEKWIAFIREHGSPGGKITFISTGATPAYPTLLYTGNFPGSRYIQAFPIAMFWHGHETYGGRGPLEDGRSKRTPEEQRFLDELGSDVMVRKPELIAILDSAQCQGCPPGFRINEYLDRIGWKGQYLKSYHFVTRFKDFAVYRRNRVPN